MSDVYPLPSKSPSPCGGTMALSQEEMRLIRRLRGLHSGAHLCIIQRDGAGLIGFTLLESGKIERLRGPDGREQAPE